MEESPVIGKIPPAISRELIFPHLGAQDKNVLAGPQRGADVSIIEVAGQAMSFTTKPVFMVPEYGWERAAWFATHALISSTVTCGLPPKYLSVNLNLPVEVTEGQLAIIWETLHQECEKMGVAIIAEHIGRYENCRFPMVGGATIVGVGALERYIGPKFIKPGDKIIITKGPAIEAAGILGTMSPIHIEQSLGKDTARKASNIFYKMSVATEAMAAVSVGVRDDGVSAMHSAAECGIWGGLHEMAEAAGMGIKVDQDKIVMEPGVSDICRLYGIDPYASISGGTLIVACRPHRAEEAVNLIQKQGVKASVVGELTEKEQGMVLIRGGNPRSLTHPIVDPFWRAFHTAMERLGKK